MQLMRFTVWTCDSSSSPPPALERLLGGHAKAVLPQQLAFDVPAQLRAQLRHRVAIAVDLRKFVREPRVEAHVLGQELRLLQEAWLPVLQPAAQPRQEQGASLHESVQAGLEIGEFLVL